MKEVAPLISLDDKDEAAKRFDNFVYGLLLCELEGLPGLGRAQKQLRSTAAMLEGKATIAGAGKAAPHPGGADRRIFDLA